MKTILSMVAAAFIALSAPAQANVIYQWVTKSATGALGGESLDYLRPQFIVTDEAHGSGSMSFDIWNCLPVGCLANTGDASGFVNAGWAWEMPGLGRLKINVTFNQDGTLSGSIFQGGINQDFQVTGTGNQWAGGFGSDFFSRCNVGSCQITGEWQKVSEPASGLMLGGAMLVLLGLITRRRRAL